jgi:hypothetical protein
MSGTVIIENNGKEIKCRFICTCKKIEPVHAIELEQKTTIESLEGEHTFQKGDFKLTNKQDYEKNITNKSWGMKRENFLEKYEPIIGIENFYKKKMEPVKAYELLYDENIHTRWGKVLYAKKGDILIIANKNDMWSIKKDIWQDTYKCVDN